MVGMVQLALRAAQH